MAIYKDKKRGTYYVSVYVTYRNGERKRVLRRGFKTRQEAQRAEAEIILDATIEDPDNPLFEDVVDEYLEWYERRNKATSVHRMKKEARLYLKPFFKGKRIQDIRKRDIMKFHDFLLDKLAISSAKNVHGYLSTLFNYAIKMEYTKVNVAREVGNIKASASKKMDYWSLEEFKKFMNFVENPKYQALFMCLFYSGARIGELLGLTWNDVDFNKNTLNINKTASMGKITTPKTKSSIRTIIMPNHTMNLLRILKLQINPKDDYYIFGEFYDPLTQNAVSLYYHKLFKKIIEEKGKDYLKKIRIHDFRHSHASYLINNGYDIQIVSKRLGHAKVSTTYDIYSHLYPNKEEEAVARMEEDFKPADVIHLIK